MKRRIYCTIPQDQIKEPILYQLGNKFQVVPNIRGASVTDEIALLSLELEGAEREIGNAIQWLRERGITVDELSDPASV